MPSSAVVINMDVNEITDPLWIGKERIEIEEAKTCNKAVSPYPQNVGENLQISGWAEGDDRRPAITKASTGEVFITYQHDEGILTSSAGFTYNANPLDAEAWFNNGVILSLQGVDTIYYPDTATCEHPDYELMNVFVTLDTEEAGGMYISDLTDYETWEIYTWTEGAPEPEFAGISDGGWYQDLYYDDVIGPFNFYIYHEIYDVYDIPSCPIFFHNGIDAASGVGYFDAQSFEQTAPAADPDYVNLPDRIHTCVYNVDTEKIVWKKIDPEVETDYEFTPYQATVADGTNPSIGAYENNVAIVYAHEENIKCVYSSDDGETWSTEPVVIGPGGFPDVYVQGSMIFAGYVNNGNLYVVSSNDGGQTWTTPQQKNDEEGTVVAEENCIDVHSGGIVWVDERNGPYNIYYTTLFSAPSIPTITGPNKGDPNTEYTFKFKSTDPDGGDVYYFIEWGDETDSGWIGPYASGVETSVKHTYTSKEVFNIRAKAKNDQGFESDWATHKFSTPKNKALFLNFLEKFPNILPILRYLFGL